MLVVVYIGQTYNSTLRTPNNLLLLQNNLSSLAFDPTEIIAKALKTRSHSLNYQLFGVNLMLR